MQGPHGTTGQFELPGRFQGNRRGLLLQADGVTVIKDRLRTEATKPAQQVTDAGRAAAGRFVGRRRQVTQPEAELLMFGSDTEIGLGLAPGREILSQLADRRDRRRVAVSRIGHALPRRLRLKGSVLAAPWRLQQCQPGEACGLGPQDARTKTDTRYKGAPAQGVKLCQRKAPFGADQQSDGASHWL